MFQANAEQTQGDLGTCATCGAPSPNEVCAFCRLLEQTAPKPAAPVQKKALSKKMFEVLE